MKFHESPNTYVGCVDLKVQDLNRSISFYQEVIGFKILEKSERKVLLTADGKKPLLSLEQPENNSPLQPKRTGLFHFALLLPNRSDLGGLYLHLAKLGVRLGASDHLVSEALYLSDPDGNGIEIYIDRPENEWKWKNGEVAMATNPMDSNGVLAAGRGKPWTELPPETVMGHIHLHVSNLEQAEAFYKLLGFDVVCRYPGALFTSTGGYHHHIGLNIWNGTGIEAPPVNSVGLKTFTLIYPSEEERNEIVEILKVNNVAFNEEERDLLVVDPSGNNIKLVF